MVKIITTWIIILSILAFFVLIFTVRARVTLELVDRLSLSVRIFGFKIDILPKKQKKYRLSDYTPKKIAKRDKKKAIRDAKKAEKKRKKQSEKQKEKNLSKEERKKLKAEKKASRPTLPDSIELFSRIARLFFSKLFRHLHFHVARIKIKVGAPDAAKVAMLYCGICTALKPTLIFLDKYSNLHGMKKADIDISPDFLSEKLSMDIKLGFSMSLGGLLAVLFRTVFSFIFGWIKIKPNKASSKTDDDSADKNPKSNAKTKNESNPSVNEAEATI